MEQLKCTQCANEALQFVNLPYQEKKQPILFRIVLILSLVIFIITLPITVLLFFAVFADFANAIGFVVFGCVTLVTGGVSLTCYVFLKLIPPDTYSDLCYVCSMCGRVESILRDVPKRTIF